MRYIGSKRKLLPFLMDSFASSSEGLKGALFADLFAGTACVGEAAKHAGARVISNDYLAFSYCLQMEKIGLNSLPFPKGTYQEILNELNSQEGTEGFFFANYCAEGSAGGPHVRSYFSSDNARKIDAAMKWLRENRLSESITREGELLLRANLIDAVTRVSNTAGTYGSFLKKKDARMDNPLTLEPSVLYDNKMKNRCYNEDIFDLIDVIQGDILYLDPPYNSRQYPPYYHILETLALDDNPAIYGRTGRRPYEDKLSPLCMREKAEGSLIDLVRKAQFESVFISYSTDGIIDHEHLMAELGKFGRVSCYYQNASRYKSNSVGAGHRRGLKEILIHVEK